jgi:hypothetical protein
LGLVLRGILACHGSSWNAIPEEVVEDMATGHRSLTFGPVWHRMRGFIE